MRAQRTGRISRALLAASTHQRSALLTIESLKLVLVFSTARSTGDRPDDLQCFSLPGEAKLGDDRTLLCPHRFSFHVG